MTRNGRRVKIYLPEKLRDSYAKKLAWWTGVVLPRTTSGNWLTWPCVEPCGPWESAELRDQFCSPSKLGSICCTLGSFPASVDVLDTGDGDPLSVQTYTHCYAFSFKTHNMTKAFSSFFYPSPGFHRVTVYFCQFFFYRWKIITLLRLLLSV